MFKERQGGFGSQHLVFEHCAIDEVNLALKGKAIPLQAWTGPEGSRSLRFPDFKTIGT